MVWWKLEKLYRKFLRNLKKVQTRYWKANDETLTFGFHLHWTFTRSLQKVIIITIVRHIRMTVLFPTNNAFYMYFLSLCLVYTSILWSKAVLFLFKILEMLAFRSLAYCSSFQASLACKLQYWGLKSKK